MAKETRKQGQSSEQPKWPLPDGVDASSLDARNFPPIWPIGRRDGEPQPITQPLVEHESKTQETRDTPPESRSVVPTGESFQPLDIAPQYLSSQRSHFEEEVNAAGKRLTDAVANTYNKRVVESYVVAAVASDAQQHIQNLTTRDVVDQIVDWGIGGPLVAAAENNNPFAKFAVNNILAAREHSQRYEAASGHHTPQKLTDAILPIAAESIPVFGDIIDGTKQVTEIIPSKDIYGNVHFDAISKALGAVAGYIPVPAVTSATVSYLRNVLERSVERNLAQRHPNWIQTVETRRAELRIGRELKKRFEK